MKDNVLRITIKGTKIIYTYDNYKREFRLNKNWLKKIRGK